jgi:hypothetical protein
MLRQNRARYLNDLSSIEDEALENEEKEPALEDKHHQDIREGDPNVNPPFRATVPERERSPSLESDLEDVTPPVRILRRRELKEQISSLTGQLGGYKLHAQTQQVASRDIWIDGKHNLEPSSVSLRAILKKFERLREETLPGTTAASVQWSSARAQLFPGGGSS